MIDYRTWKINLWTCWGTQMIDNIAFGMVIPFLAFFMVEFDPNMTDAELAYYTGLSITLPSLSMAIAAPIWGFISDLYGRKAMLIRAMVCATVLLFVMGSVKTVGVFLVLRFFHGIFTGTLSPAMSLVSASTPPEKMSYSLGLMTSAVFLGWAIGQMFATPVVAIVGYRGSFYVAGVLMLINTFISFIPKEDPSTFGKELFRQRREEKRLAKLEKKEHKAGMLSVAVITMLVSIMVLRMGRTMFTPFIAIFVKDTLGTMEGANFYTGCINAAGCVATAISSVTITKLADKHDKVTFSIVLITLGTLFEFLLIPNFPLTVFILGYAGLFFFAGPVEPVLASAMSEVTEPGLRGTLFGLNQTMTSLAMMLGPLISSFITASHSSKVVLLVMPVLLIASIIMLGVIVLTKKNKPAVEADA